MAEFEDSAASNAAGWYHESWIWGSDVPWGLLATCSWMGNWKWKGRYEVWGLHPLMNFCQAGEIRWRLSYLYNLGIDNRIKFEWSMPSLTPSLSATSTQQLLSASLSLVVFVQARAQMYALDTRGIPGRCRSHSLFQFERRSQYCMFTSIHYSELISRWTKLTIKPIQIVQHPLLISLEQLPISKYRLKTWRSIIVPQLYIVI